MKGSPHSTRSRMDRGINEWRVCTASQLDVLLGLHARYKIIINIEKMVNKDKIIRIFQIGVSNHNSLRASGITWTTSAGIAGPVICGRVSVQFSNADVWESGSSESPR